MQRTTPGDPSRGELLDDRGYVYDELDDEDGSTTRTTATAASSSAAASSSGPST